MRKAPASSARHSPIDLAQGKLGRLSPHERRWCWLCLLATLVLASCATMAPPQPPSLELPKPPADLRAVRKGDSVVLSWTVPIATTDRQTVRMLGATRICRGMESPLTQCGTPVGQVVAPPSPAARSAPARAKSSKQKATGSYTDSLSAQMGSDGTSSGKDRFVTYAVEVLNTNGRDAGLSNQVRVPTVRTVPPPRDFAARVTDQGVVLSWTNELPAASSTVHYVYRVFRRLLGSQESHLVGEVAEGATLARSSMTDSSMEWQKTYEYRAETVTVIDRAGEAKLEIEGDDTPEVRIFADDAFPPAVPAGVQAVFSGPGQKTFIDLAWAPVTDADLDGYNVYRREEGSAEKGSAAVKVSSALVKEPAYRDERVISGKTYVYSVSAVDVRGNESARSEEASERVP
jgi:hypothetical protein